MWPLALLAACAQSEPVKDAQRIISLEQIEGEWDVASFGDFRVDLANNEGRAGHYVKIARGALAYRIGCNSSGNPASIDGKGVLHDLSKGSRLSTLVGCPPVQERRDGAFYAFFGSRPVVTREAQDRIVMDNGIVKLVLERPERRRLAFLPGAEDLKGRWVILSATSESGGGVGTEDPVSVITMDDRGAVWTACPDGRVAWQLETPGRLVHDPARTAPGCFAAMTTGNDGKRLVEQALRGDPLAERAPRGVLELRTASGIALTLQREAEFVAARDAPPSPVPPGIIPPPPPPPPPPLPLVQSD